jgi:DivIVA domain-containing protein
MALTPEQVLNKHFQTTQFRRGYEERDVDDFLDEIVAEMRSLIEQRDDYLKQLNDCRAGKNQPAVRQGDASTAAMPAVGRPGDDAKLAGLSAKIQDAERAYKAASERAAKAKAEAENAEKIARERIERAKADSERAELAAKSAVDSKALNEAQAKLNDLNSRVADAEAKLARAQAEADAAERKASVSSAAMAAGAPSTVGTDAAGVIALAQRLHDEHVRDGQTKREALITEAQTRHDDLIRTAQSKFDELTSSGQAKFDEASRKAAEISATAIHQRDQMIAEATAKRDEMLTEARERATGMVAEAQQRKAAILEDLERQKNLLDRKIEELRGFEQSYRSKMKSYIETQLTELNSSEHLGSQQAGQPQHQG